LKFHDERRKNTKSVSINRKIENLELKKKISNQESQEMKHRCQY
jgi:hypothetical protein